MNTHRSPPAYPQNAVRTRDVGGFSTIRIRNGKCKCRPVTNKEGNKQPSYLLSTFIIEAANSNGGGISDQELYKSVDTYPEGQLIIVKKLASALLTRPIQ